MRWQRRSARWAVPAGAVAIIGAVVAGTAMAAAAGSPELPRTTPAALLAAARTATPPTAFTATVTQTAALGLPQLPDMGGISSPLAALTGTHSLNIWANGPGHLRIEWPSSFGERDLRVDGSQVWLWDSSTQTATRITRPNRVLPPAARPRPVPAPGPAGGAGAPGGALSLTPLQAAQRLLAAVGPTTAVSVDGTTTVAGRDAYVLVVAPRSAQSLIGQIRIAVDAKLHLPLQVQVYARGAASPALTVGFTKLTIGTPAASNFSFTPPAGAKVRTQTVPLGAFPGPGVLLGVPGMAGIAGWSGSPPSARPIPAARVLVPAGLRTGRQAVIIFMCGADGKRQLVSLRLRPGARLIRLPRPSGAIRLPCRLHPGAARVQLRLIQAPALPGMKLALSSAGPRVLGSGWLSVVVLPAGPATAGISGGPHPLPAASGSIASGSRPIAGLPAGPLGALGPLAATLLRAATAVHGTWGSGRLLRTALLSVLITNNGKILIGAVTPAVLYADAASAK